MPSNVVKEKIVIRLKHMVRELRATQLLCNLVHESYDSNNKNNSACSSCYMLFCRTLQLLLDCIRSIISCSFGGS